MSKKTGEKARNEARSKALVARRMMSNIPEEHRATDDTRAQWLWNQRLIQVQHIYQNTDNIRDRMMCALVLGAAWSANLPSVELLLKRLEGGSIADVDIMDDEETLIL